MRPDQVLPFYVLCDESFSMMDHLDALNEGLRELHRAVRDDPVVAERTRFCLIGFSGSAQVLVPLCRLNEVTEMSVLTTGAATNFGAAFTFLRQTIERDVHWLATRFRLVYRPAVFFMSDGQPTDPATWPAAFAALTDPSWSARPFLIAFGIGDADPATIGKIGTFRAFISQDGVSPTAALHEFARALTTSIVRTGGSPHENGEVLLHVPDTVPGFTAVPVEPV